jgi:hypothetical protein
LSVLVFLCYKTFKTVGKRKRQQLLNLESWQGHIDSMIESQRVTRGVQVMRIPPLLVSAVAAGDFEQLETTQGAFMNTLMNTSVGSAISGDVNPSTVGICTVCSDSQANT